MGREKPPSKDGAAQRAAGEVAGLKDFVCQFFLQTLQDAAMAVEERKKWNFGT